MVVSGELIKRASVIANRISRFGISVWKTAPDGEASVREIPAMYVCPSEFLKVLARVTYFHSRIAKVPVPMKQRVLGSTVRDSGIFNYARKGLLKNV